MAIAKWPTPNGPADYALFVGTTCLGVVEAKRKRKNVSAAIDQAGRYAQGFELPEGVDVPDGGPWIFQSGPASEPPFRIPVGIPRHLKVYPVDVRLIWPVAKRGRPRRRYIPDILSMPAEDMLADAKWQMVSWRTGTKGKLKACFAAVRIRTADGPPQRIKDKGQQHLPGDEAWLIGELRASGEKKYYLAFCPLRPICALWLPPSRHVGFASKPISS
jgi:hypothetical protein